MQSVGFPIQTEKERVIAQQKTGYQTLRITGPLFNDVKIELISDELLLHPGWRGSYTQFQVEIFLKLIGFKVRPPIIKAWYSVYLSIDTRRMV